MKESLHITQPMSNPAFDLNRRDPLFEAVAHDVVEWQTVSVSTVCGQFHIEQNRAKRIVRQLEQAHIIGEQWSARHSREILCCCTRTLNQRLADLATVARLQPLEDQWQAECAKYEAKVRKEEGEGYYFKIANNLPLKHELREQYEVQARYEAMTEVERQAEMGRLDKECEKKLKDWGKGPVHGMKREDWNAYTSALGRLNHDRVMRELSWGGNYDWLEVFYLLKFKIERMIAYWEQLGHCRNRRYVANTMRTACRLINIVLSKDRSSGDFDSCRVNMHNVNRFTIYHDHKGAYDKANKQDVRYHKAYCILFKYLEFHLHNWWD